LLESLEQEAKELLELEQLAQETEDVQLMHEIYHHASELAHKLEEQEQALVFSDPYDDHDAFVSIHAGAGGTDSQDWALMLLRMYSRWCERKGFECEIVDISEGEEAGIKSATLEVRGENAYGWFKSEKGVHRLIRLSPFDAAHRRHTSFALVEVIPKITEEINIEILPQDIRVDTFRATGHGGQHVNKTDSAVRITHIPTGIVVTCQNERSQLQNRETAMQILKARLFERQRAELEEKKAQLKGKHVKAEWGNQIRTYVLHPNTMVKDHRTGYETSNIQAVLEGELDELVQSYLKWSIQNR